MPDERGSSGSGGLADVTRGEWVEHAPGTAYRCEARVLAAEGRFVATAAKLPAVTADGATEKEALDNLALALAGAIAERKRNGEQALPEKTAPPAGAAVRYVLVRL